MVTYETERELRIVLADDHEVVRAGLRRLLLIDKSLKILDEAENGIDAIELVKYHRPDIVMLDILMPKMDGIEATENLKKLFPDIPIVMLTAFEDSMHIEKALAAGANGYLSKDISSKDLVDAIHRVYQGERVFSKTILHLLQKKYLSYTDTDSTPVVITKREQEILDLVAQGLSSPKIADKLFISVRTVQSHRANIMEKLGVKNAAGLVRYAMYNLSTIKNSTEKQ